jgi:hypothetical protein
MNVVHRAAGGQLSGRGNWRTGFQHLNHARAPFRGRGLIFDVGIDAIEQAFRAELGQLAVEIFAGLAEEFIRGIAEAKDGERGPVQLRRFFENRNLCNATASSGGSPSPGWTSRPPAVFPQQFV